ncbi:MAG: diguanylate cyclase [Deltaproteobacteria bacterium]|nr:diguanylate cyclase [Deltaproteobacteria bacterium]
MAKALDFSKEKVLVVDDDDLLRSTLQQLLAALYFKVDSAPSGTAALGMLAEKNYTFLLTDMKMPEMDGFTLIQRVSAEFPKVSIIAMTGYAEGYKYVDVISAGAADFIKKPFDLEELEAKIARIINERTLKEELSRLSITDALTGLYNQRHFYARLREEMIRSERQRHLLALILIDLDNFKHYNDTHGHLAGDEVLRNVGRLINKSIRVGVDSGYRYGGDEFAIILIDADLGVAREIGKRIQDAFIERMGLGASMGYAIFSDGMSAEDLVAEADKGLYGAKPKK